MLKAILRYMFPKKSLIIPGSFWIYLDTYYNKNPFNDNNSALYYLITNVKKGYVKYSVYNYRVGKIDESSCSVRTFYSCYFPVNEEYIKSLRNNNE